MKKSHFSKYFSRTASSMKGFTLIEMMVATAIFSAAMLIIVGALVSLNNASNQARALRLVTDNLSAAIDSMSRNLRMGATFHCGCGGVGDPTFPDGPQDCSLASGGGACLAFEGQLGNFSTPSDQIVYKLTGHSIQRAVDGGAGASSYVDMTAPEITIKNLRFYVYGSQPDTDQPVVITVIQGVASTSPKYATDFNIETVSSARRPNISLLTP